CTARDHETARLRGRARGAPLSGFRARPLAALFEDLISKVVDFHDTLVRNIKGMAVSQALFDDLSEDPEDNAVAIAAESAQRIPSAAPLITRPFDYGSVITFPFIPYSWHATRFSDGLRFGVWYGSLDIETTIHETVYHWHRFVMNSFANENRVIRGERRVFSVRCQALLVDLRGKHRKFPKLCDRGDYAFGQQLGAYLEGQQQNGLLHHSARCDGVNAAILRPQVLSEPRDRCFLFYAMNPAQDRVVVKRGARKPWLTIKPSLLY
ncbi:MAG: RES family NAD+ phosphorylase, partial [Burkholderiales bacterium]